VLLFFALRVIFSEGQRIKKGRAKAIEKAASPKVCVVLAPEPCAEVLVLATECWYQRCLRRWRVKSGVRASTVEQYADK